MTLYTSKVIAQWLCLTERRVRQLRDEGVIVEARPGLYELQPTVARYIKVYFCHPYSSWERGTNENTNGMIRRRFPKGTNFAAVTNAQIAQAENWINNYPRKILGYRSSEIVFRECLRELGIAA